VVQEFEKHGIDYTVVGATGNTFRGHGMAWDNSGKNAHYAPIRWSNQS
jgi:hypothetical protein